jgi:hypothetical protein
MLPFRTFVAWSLNSLRWLGLAGMALGLGGRLGAAEGTGAVRDDFSPSVKLAPFVVQGESLEVSIHARSGRDRRYAERFSEEVIKVVYEGLTPSTGRGLVIIGKEGEPHPIRFFRRFLALADAGQLDPAVAARGPELFGLLNHWERSIRQRQGRERRMARAAPAHLDMDIDVEQIFTALPLPLEGIRGAALPTGLGREIRGREGRGAAAVPEGRRPGEHALHAVRLGVLSAAAQRARSHARRPDRRETEGGEGGPDGADGGEERHADREDPSCGGSSRRCAKACSWKPWPTRARRSHSPN